MNCEKMALLEAVDGTELPVTGYADPAEIPGVIVVDDRAFYDVGGQLFPVTGAVKRHGRLVPILDMPIDDVCPRKDVQAGMSAGVLYGGCPN